MKNVGIVGLGYVGLTLAIAFADKGIHIYGIETKERIKECLRNKHAHFFEPGLDDLIAVHMGKTFKCIDKFEDENIKYDAFIITVGTPLVKGKKEPNFDYIKTALDAIRDVYDGSQLVVLRSTVSVGTTRNTVIPYLKRLAGDGNVYVAMCPERTIEGKAVYELSSLPQIVSGNDEEAVRMAEKLFQKLSPKTIRTNSLEAAELVKLYNNTYRDITFAIGNAFCLAAQMFGVDGMSVIRNANEGYHRADIKMPGFVAGPCLEKDAYLLTSNMSACESRDFILQARHLNEKLVDNVVQWVDKIVGKNHLRKEVAISGMSFKGNPPTSDLRGSTSVDIAKKLLDKGYMLYLHDYVADKKEMQELHVGEVSDSFDEVCKKADIVLILNNHENYKNVSLGEFKSTAIVLDAWGIMNYGQAGEFPEIYTLGNFAI